MSRERSDLGVDDLRWLAKLVAEPRRSVAAAAGQLGIERARLIRMLDRVNFHLGGQLPWRASGRFSPPVEIRRLVCAFRAFTTELESIRGPRVSAGPSAAMLLAQVVGFLKEPMPHLRIVRARDTAEALLQDRVDVALLHASSTGKWPLKLSSNSVLNAVSLLPWRAVRIRSRRGRGDSRKIPLEWDPGSTGERLAKAHQDEPGVGVRWPCASFVQALEMVRRGVVAEAIVPDIYVAPSDPELVAEPLANPTEDSLVAVCRCDDMDRWEQLLRPEVWSEASKVGLPNRKGGK